MAGADNHDDLRAALLGLRKLKARVAELEGEARAPIAVIGMACRFPGADDPDAFWSLLERGVDAVGPIPADRWDAAAYLREGAAADAPGALRSDRAGVLSDVARFDADLFGISHREARSMDPQQRLLLECAWAALEDAGRRGDVEGSDTGVFLGVALTDWERRTLYHLDPTQADLYAGTGSFGSVAAGRISYALGLRGPAVALDTACSSSLVAIHLAVRSLRSGEARMALAGGVNLLLTPDPSLYFNQMGALSPTGSCKAFDAAADGYVRAEGVGVVVLKRLDHALADGDRVLAVIRGSAVNQDGRSNGLTAPSPDAQKAVLRAALRDAGAQAHEVGLVEAHGTGTPLGDPIEVEALAEVYGAGERPLVLGAVKSVIGHAEAAAGVAGFIKAVQALRAGRVPANLHFREANPRLRLAGTRLVVADGARPVDGLVGVSGFGMSGTNAHILLGPAPALPALGAARRLQLVVLSAPDEARLDALRGAAAARLAGDVSLADAAFTAGVGRVHLAHRVAVVAADAAEAAARLAAAPVGLARRRARVGFVLGDGLADAALTALAEREPALAAIVASAEGRPGHAAWAAARLLEAWGIEAAAVIGAGGGEAGARALVGALDAPWSEAALARPQRWLGLGSDGTAAAVRDRADVWVGLGAPGDLTLEVGDDVERGLLDVVAALYLRGVEPKWEALHPARPRRVAWPGTAFAGPRLWLDDPVEQLRAERRRDERAWREVDVAVTLPAGRDGAVVLDLRGAVDEAAALRAVLDAVAVGRVVVLTRGCDVGPAAAIWGLGRVVASERPDRWGGLIDCGDADEAQVADAIARADGRDLRLVGGQLVERRLGPGPAAAALSPSTDGVWWIAGGLGALGLATARWLVGRGVRRLALSARRDVATTPEIEALRASGAEVQVVRGDLSTVDGAAAARAAIGGPVVGVVHAAGLLEDRALGEVDDALLARHLAAKVGVLRALAAATAGDPLQALVVIGSATVSLGIPGQAAYAAANGALRAEVAALRAAGRPGRLVELGPVEGGMADEATRRRLAAVGIGALSLDEAAELVMRPDGVAIRLDPARYARSAAGPRIAAFLGVERPAALAAAPTVDRAAVVAEELARVLGREDLQGLDTSRGFFELGLDSMTAVAFARALEDRLGVPVPPTVAFDHGDLAALVAWLTPAEVQAPVAAASARSDEPVAIIGMACRMPGADDPDAFWAALRSGVDLVRPIPASRWDVEALFDPTPGAAGRSYVREMATIDGVEGFDAAFFGVAPREAASLDPQQRLLLEVGVEALEHAGVPLDAVSRSKTGVYVGIGPSDYARRFDVMNGPADAYAGTGNESSFAAGRLAYVLGAQGPAMGLNTACSTSLVTTHLAVQALQAGECELALAGGVNLVLSPETTVQLCQLQALSPTARCHTFSADADGYARGEGAGMLVLKRLSDARRDGDRVLGVIVGSAVNHDGPSAGLTVPSGSAQQALLRTALGRAGLRPDEVDLLEAHGTGTKLGDPIEMGAVKAVYGARPAERPLIVGSIKTHVGHLELAAGVAGVIATVEALRRREVAPHLHLGAVNPALDLDFPVRIPTAPASLPAEGVVRGAVSSFGLSGTNAHVIVEGGAPDGVGEAPERSHHVLVWSARTAAAAEAMPARLAAALAGKGPAEVADLAWSLHTGRSRAKFGGAVVGADADALIAKLGEGVAPVEAARRPVVWMFTGQGSQARGMGAALRSHPAYRDVLDRADAVLLRLRGEALSAVIDEDGPRLEDTAWTQPALVAVELGLAAVLTSLGMAPDLVIGHSVGEIAAACVAGALDVEAAITLAAERGRLMSALPAGGGMVQVALREDLVRERLRPGLDVAAVNAGDETVVSGDVGALDALVAELEAANIRCRRLVVSHAFHSARMDPMLDAFEAVVAATPLRTPRIPVLSNLEARPVTDALTQPAYWRRHVREAVRFADALRTAPERALLVELGPHPVLAGLAARVRSDVVVVPTLRRGRPAWEGLAEAVGALACRGVDLDLAAWDAPWRRAKVAVPLTPWAKARHWVERVDSGPVAPGRGLLRVMAWEAAGGVRGGRRWCVEGADAAAIAAALAAAGDAAQVGWDGEGDAVWAAPDGAPAGDEVLREGFARLQACREAGRRLTVVTAGVSEGDALAAAPLWGLLRGAALELPEVAVGLVDVVGGDAVAAAAALRSAEPVRRWRAGVVEAPRLRATDGDPALAVRGTWWVTGGTGAVGRAIGAWLRAQGAERVVLTGRRAPAEPLPDGLELLTGDVADAADVARMVAALGPLRGVVHAAGALADTALARMDEAALLAVRPAKVQGAWNVHQATAAMELDALVLVSSAAGTLGWTGQAAYGAANAWLDALARRRSADGQRTVSVAWGPWAGGGMADSGVQAAMAAVGMRAMAPAAALGALQRALGGGLVDVLAADLDLTRWAPRHPWGPALVGQEAPEAAASPSKAGPALHDRRAVEATVRGIVARVLGHADAAGLDATQGLFDLGMDSLMAVQLARELAAATGVAVSDTVAFDRPSIEALTALITDHAAPAAAVVAARSDEPIAIVGLACRFPGGVHDVETLWALLSEGRDAIGPVPRERWDNEAFYDPTPGVPGRTYVREGGFLDDVAGFEPGLFGIAPREAVRLDPQQRLLLEATWHALEDAGVAPDRLRGTRAAIYVGVGGHDYERIIERAGGPDEDDGYTGTGNDLAFAAGRLAWHLGTHGPTLSFDTACSSSLVAVHHAVRALRDGEADLGLAGAVRLMLSPESTLRLSALRALSPRARCRTFDVGADGYVRGEGVGVVVLKRLSDARRDGDRVLAVIAASAVNHDGASSGLTVPSGDAQARLLREVIGAAGVAAEQVDAVEAHGTGTALGDPIEVGALVEVLGQRPADRPLRVGSIKTQVGHLELAAGMAGLAKLVVGLAHNTLPGQLHFTRWNPSIPRSDALSVLTRAEPWPRDHRRLALVSAFGLSGTNAALLVGDAPDEGPAPERSDRSHHLLVVHGATLAGLEANAAATAAWLRRHPGVAAADVAATLAVGRARLRHRRALVVRDAAEAAELLGTGVGAVDGVVRRGAARPGVCFLFTGQGSQYVGMARGLYEAFPVVREVIDRCDAACRATRGEGLLPVLFPRDGRSPIDQTAWTQPALFAVELAVATLWRSLGVEPDLLIGHSIGEIAAATFGGVLSIEDGFALVEARGRLMQALPQDGAMGAVFAPLADVEAARARYGELVDVAAVNGPEETVVSGDAAAVRELLRTFELRGVRVRELTVSHAFHSAKMAPMLEAFGAVVAGLTLRPSRTPIVSNLTAEIAGEAHAEPGYWVRHVREAVRFAPAVAAAHAEGARWFIEVGPHPVLAGLGARALPGAEANWVASLRRGAVDLEALLTAVGTVHTTGFDVALEALDGRARPGRLGLPGTVFQRERWWVEGGEAHPTGIVAAPAWTVAWRELAAPPAAARTWWVIEGPDSAAIADALAAAGHRVSAVVAAADLERGLAEAAVRVGPPDAIVAVLGDGSVEASAGRLLELATAAPRALGQAARLWAVTRGAWSGQPAAAAAWGLGRVLALEQPSAWGGLVDLDADWTPAGVAAALVDTSEDQARVGATRRVARLVAAPLEAEARLDGVVVVTGGLGVVGLQLAGRCVDQGATALVLNGRRGPSDEAARQLAAWRARGVEVVVVPGDVVEAAPALAAEAARLGGARLVIHAAGALDDGLIAGLSWARVEGVLAAKVSGARALDAAMPDAPLLLVSSAASWLGSVGQGAYAAANAYLDAFAEAHSRADRPVTAVAYGPWGGGGMAAAHLDDMARRGVRALAPASALAATARLWRRGGAVAVADADWAVFREVFEAGRRRGLLDELAPRAAAVTPEPRARRGAAHEVVAAAAAAVLGARGKVDPDQGFFELGMDSLMTVTLAERLSRELGREVPPSAVLDHPSVNRLAGWLRDGDAEVAEQPVSAVSDDPVVIVGMACRFPGAPDVASFWRLLEEGRCAVGEAPRSRWPELDGLLHPEPGTPGRTYTSRGAFLDQIESFDAPFFGMSPREAEAMDPQQRLLLEVSWEALEDAGLAPAGLGESRTGVFVGMGASEYDVRFQRRAASTPDAYSGTGNDTSFAAGRVAWRLGLRGPAMTVNTACSASLVSLHLAGQALRLGECDLALAGGVNLMVSSDSTVRLSALRALSPTGLCRAFDAAADGYVRGEGAGVVVLERLSDARRNGHRVLAVVRGSAVNHDGASSALTVPSGPAQTALLREAWRRAGVTGDELGYVEAHGTGTRLGDPIEARALAAALGPRRRPLYVGSVKTNVGHLELAAGAAGLIKAVLALRHRRIPAHLHLSERNPEIPADLPLRFNGEAVDWEGPLVAGVSSFGLSGTNAHVVLAAGEELPASAPLLRPALLALAARGAGALDQLGRSVAGALDDEGLADVVHTAARARTSGWHRLVVVGDGREAVADALRGATRDGLVRGEASPEAPKLALVYGGLGSAWAGMGLALEAGSPVVADTLRELDAAARPLLGRGLAEVDPVGHGGAAWVALVALQIALTRQLRAWGVEPDVVAAHGAGEVTAAWAAGVWSAADAIAVAFARGEATSAQAPGAMTAFVASEARVREGLAGLEAWVAVVNGPESTVVGGTVEAMAELGRRLGDVVAFPLPHRVALHTPAMAGASAAVEAAVAGTARSAPTIPVVTGAEAPALTEPAWWGRRVAEPVRFVDVTRRLAELDVGLCLEIGPSPQLLGFLRRGTGGRAAVGVCRRDREWETLLEAIGEAWVRGVRVDLPSVCEEGHLVSLPTTPFERRRHWVEEAVVVAAAPVVAVAAPPKGVAALIQAEAERLLGLAPGQLDLKRPLAWQGFDSIMAADLKVAIDRAFGVVVPTDAVVSGPSVGELTAVVEALRKHIQ